MRRLHTTLFAIVLLSAPALAAQSSSTPKAKDPDKIVCKVDRTTGSSISERVCKKRSVWEAEKVSAREHLDQGRRMNADPEILRGRGGG